MGFARRLEKWVVFVACAAFLVPCGLAQKATADAATVPALLVSDIHFEPFWDPAKAAQLQAAPVTRWSAILAAPGSPDRAQRFAALEKSCHAKGVDTSYDLLASSLRAMRAHGAGVRFITLSGDLIAHDFDCKFDAVFPHAQAAAYPAFVAKTIAFVELELHGSFPQAALFTALGNNDSDCGDYKLDARGTLLANIGPLIVANLGAPQAQRAQALRTFLDAGDYNVPMPAPVQHARMIVLDDLFMSRKYRSCSGRKEEAPAAGQIAWLRRQLMAARRNREKVWFMAHIPTGIDPVRTALKMRDVCGAEPAETFLSSDALAGTLAEFGDVVQLAIFAHTHMDEMRLLMPNRKAGESPAVPVKIVSSISPVDGNNPSFTIAQVNAATAELVDYQVYAASNQTGVDTAWSKEYDFADTYHEPAFTADSVGDLFGIFHDDKNAQTAQSRSYLRNYFVGDRSAILKAFWPEYVCALANRSASAYRACVCSGK